MNETTKTIVTTRMIEAFRAVMLAGGITRGAVLQHVSQPSISRLIAGLERGLRIQLFERRGTRVIPTDEAHALYAEVERSFVGLERILATASRIRERRLGHLRIASIPLFGFCELPDAIAGLSRTTPKVFVQLDIMPSAAAQQAVATGHADLAFAHMPADASAFAVVRRYGGPCACIMPPKHPLANQPAVRPKMLANIPFISLGPSSLTRAEVDEQFAAAGVERRQIVAETSQSSFASELVMRGVGIAIVDPFVARRHAAHGGAVRTFNPRIDCELTCLTRAGHRPVGPALRLIEILDRTTATVRP